MTRDVEKSFELFGKSLDSRDDIASVVQILLCALTNRIVLYAVTTLISEHCFHYWAEGVRIALKPRNFEVFQAFPVERRLSGRSNQNSF